MNDKVFLRPECYVEYRNQVGEIRYQARLQNGEREYGESMISSFINRMALYPDIRYWLNPEVAGDDDYPVLYETPEEAVKTSIDEQNRRDEIDKHTFYEVK